MGDRKVTFEQHRQALKRAVDAGDEAAVRDIEAILDTYPESKAYGNTPSAYSGVTQALDSAQNQARNLWAGANELKLKGQIGLGDALGFNTDYNKDSLDQLNTDYDARNRAFNERVPDGLPKTIGSIAGDVVGAGPFAAAAAPYTVGRGLLSRAAIYGLEGAAFGGITTKGDAKERLISGSVEGTLNAVGGPVIDRATSLYRNIMPTSMGGKPENKFKDQIAEIRERDGRSAYGDRRVAEANELGINLDRVDAETRQIGDLDAPRDPSHRDVGHGERGVVQSKARHETSGTAVDYRSARVEQEEQLASAARDLLDLPNQTDGRAARGNSSDELVERLGNTRADELQMVDDAYARWRATEGKGIKLDTDGLYEVIDGQLGSIRQGQKGLRDDVLDIMDRLGIRARKPDDLQGKMEFDLRGAEKPAAISLNQVEEFIQEVNSLYKPNDEGWNRASRKVKDAIDAWALEGFENANQLAPGNPYRAGLEARARARDYHARWDRQTELGKIVIPDKTGAYTRNTPMKSIDSILTSGNVNRLVEFKRQLDSGYPDGSGFYEPPRQSYDAYIEAIKLEGIEQATKDGTQFNVKAFERYIQKYEPAMQIEMFGKEGYDAIQQFIRSGKLVGSTVSPKGSMNPPESAAMLNGLMKFVDGKAASFISKVPGGGLGIHVLRMLGGGQEARAIRDQFENNAKRLMNDRLPQATADRIVEEQIAALLKHEPGLSKLNKAMPHIVRQALRSLLMGKVPPITDEEKRNKKRSER